MVLVDEGPEGPGEGDGARTDPIGDPAAGVAGAADETEGAPEGTAETPAEVEFVEFEADAPITAEAIACSVLRAQLQTGTCLRSRMYGEVVRATPGVRTHADRTGDCKRHTAPAAPAVATEDAPLGSGEAKATAEAERPKQCLPFAAAAIVAGEAADSCGWDDTADICG